MRPKTITHKVTRKELDSICFPYGSNTTLIHVPHQNKDTKTDSGIYVVGDMDFKPDVHAERWGYVYTLPDVLNYNDQTNNVMGWETEIECHVGDKVWFDYRTAMYAYTLECEGEWYKVLPYTSLYVIQNDDGLIQSLNGYLLMNRYYPPKKSELSLDTASDDNFGIVLLSGTPNTAYRLNVWDDNIDVYAGDHVMFEAETACFPLEHEMHRTFPDAEVVLQHRKRVIAVIDSEHTRVERLHDGVFGVKERKEDLESGSIKLVKEQSNHRVADVVVSNNEKLPVGSVVVISKKRGTDFNGIEYLTEDRIYYYETA